MFNPIRRARASRRLPSAKLVFCLAIPLLILFSTFCYLQIKPFKPNGARTANGRQGGDLCEAEGGWREYFMAGDEEKRIFRSVREEHMQLLGKLRDASAKLDAITKMIPTREAELKELEIRIEELKLLREELSDRRSVQLKLPHSPILPGNGNHIEPGAEYSQSTIIFRSLEDSFDFSRCSISAQFRVFPYPLPKNSSNLANHFLAQLLAHSSYLTANPNEACLFVAIIDSAGPDQIHTLKHFGENGRNHLLISLSGNLSSVDAKAAMLVSADLNKSDFRPSMDFAAFLSVPRHRPHLWMSLPPLLPALRKYLVSFMANSSELSKRQVEDLTGLAKSMDSSMDPFSIDLNCTPSVESPSLCFDREERLRIGRQSSFSIIFPELPHFQRRLYESLESGSIPVICSLDQPLPFGDFIDWRLAVFRISPVRLPELHFILRSISIPDLLELKRKGRFFFEHFLADIKVLMRSFLSAIRFRLQIPGTEEPEPDAVPLYRSNGTDWVYPSFISTATKPPYDDEFLGPIEIPIDSPEYTHNFTSFNLFSSALWNEFPFATAHSLRFFPGDSPLPSNSEFNEDTSFGMRPILPGSGVEFSQALGGNRPREQFTIVIVSFNREAVLAATLERLIGLPYLNRVIVVWNGVDKPPSIAAWPRLHVPLLFVNGTRNSLNNRFVPYKQIQTEAVLSMDDDIDLKQYEIVFAFRVWRENRDRIVGFPARYHARFGDDYFYNSNHSCQFSMILTGAAFLHKFFLSAYTFHMPAVIRDRVDQWMNCEDLAINFLVSHLTRKPPIKTTSKWTLRCPTCEDSLSGDEAHFNERHECIRFFTQVYGYNPLLFSQFRADSVLFKTRVPPNHQKCFRYV